MKRSQNIPVNWGTMFKSLLNLCMNIKVSHRQDPQMQPSLPKTALRLTENEELDQEIHTNKQATGICPAQIWEAKHWFLHPKPDPFPSLEANPKQFLLEKLLVLFYHTSPSEAHRCFPQTSLSHNKDFLLLTINKQGTLGKIFLSVGKCFSRFKRAQVDQGNKRIYAAVKHWKASQLPARAQIIQPLGCPGTDVRNMMLMVLNKRHICPWLINAYTLDTVLIFKILGWIQLLDKPC